MGRLSSARAPPDTTAGAVPSVQRKGGLRGDQRWRDEQVDGGRGGWRNNKEQRLIPSLSDFHTGQDLSVGFPGKCLWPLQRLREGDFLFAEATLNE